MEKGKYDFGVPTFHFDFGENLKDLGLELKVVEVVVVGLSSVVV